MQGSSRTRGGLVHLLAGAALGAAVVLVLWMLSGGKPFGEVIGSAGVSSPTPAPVQPTEVQRRAVAPAAGGETLSKAPPSLGDAAELQFKKPAAQRKAKARRAAKRKRATARKPAVRVVAPPPAEPAEEVPVAVVPSPTPTAAAPAPPAPAPAGGGGRPAKRQAPAVSVGAGEG
jgi:hypothetical protein